MKKSFGFNLVEVLITLGIIGVVAAVTIPVLFSKYQAKMFASILKKSYSTIQNIINLASEEEGLGECYIYRSAISHYYETIGNDCPQVKNNLITRMNLSEYNATELKKKYKSQSEVLSGDGQTINWGCNYDAILAATTNYISNDGVVYYFNRYSYPNLLIDVNGTAGPNKWGYDVFFMMFTKHNDKIFLTDEYCSLIEKGGVFPRYIIKGLNNTNSYW